MKDKNVLTFRAAERDRRPTSLEVLGLLDQVLAELNPEARLPLVVALSARVSELTARVLEAFAGVAEPSDSQTPCPTRLLSVDEAAAIAGVSRRWIYDHTRGLRFRHNLSRKRVRIEEAGFRRWLSSRTS